jgi:hypothetical protein
MACTCHVTDLQHPGLRVGHPGGSVRSLPNEEEPPRASLLHLRHMCPSFKATRQGTGGSSSGLLHVHAAHDRHAGTALQYEVAAVPCPCSGAPGGLPLRSAGCSVHRAGRGADRGPLPTTLRCRRTARGMA